MKIKIKSQEKLSFASQGVGNGFISYIWGIITYNYHNCWLHVSSR